MAEKTGHQYAVLFIDLDSFKAINDSLGHNVGDQFLQHVAIDLAALLQANDLLARLGGDEFAIILDDLQNVSQAIDICERIQAQLSLPLRINHYELVLGASIGITLNKNRQTDPEAVLRDADIAMYAAKRAGKRCYAIFNAEMQTQASERLTLEADLYHALSRKEFCLHYQPIFSMVDQTLVGLEALVRWNHPRRGLLFSGDFIQIAEETGLIHDLGLWVFKAACEQIQVWLKQFPELFSSNPLLMHVNLSAIQLNRPDLIEKIKAILATAQLPAGILKLELTESSILEDMSQTQYILNELTELGIQLCIDDFGTGYSALSRLHQMPISTLKIDRSFTSNMGNDSGVEELIQTIIMLAQNLGMTTVAEGIETSAQGETLLAMGCEYGQGYFWSKPVDADTIADRFLGQPSLLPAPQGTDTVWLKTRFLPPYTNDMTSI
ncbi:MAG: bifunctional diguanylate cyclase/phosphodiesterase [Leptolyngbyaceae cyanobacterium SM2_3_12]|nr:bifunctional diguanylate cyclase/phosphodiesterase [Leptolyngbyaceae cyanobacterium SM2_3_12]